MKLYMKWSLVVGLNAISGFIWGYEDKGLVHVLGMGAGIVTWCIFYICVDRYLKKIGRHRASQKLFLSAALRVPLQLTILPDMYAGFAAVITMEFLGLHNLGSVFVSAYGATLFTGLYLSVFCAIIFAVVSGIDILRQRRNNA